MKKIYLFALLAGVVFTACDNSKGDITPSTQPSAITISPLLTRATDTSFEEGDKIGLSIVKTGGETYADNAEFTFAGGVFTGATTWYTETEVTSDLIAYYPYTSAGVPVTFSVQADQSAGNAASDFIIGVETGVTPTANTIGMTFKHVMSKVVVNVTNTTASAVTSVVLAGTKIAADVDVAQSIVTASASATATDVTLGAVTAGTQYVAILVPQEAAMTLKITAGTEYTQELELATLVQGGQHTVNATVSEAGLDITVSGAIDDWTDEGEIGAGGSDSGITYGELVYDGVTYRTIELSNGQTWMADPLRYVPAGYTVSDDPAADAHIWYPYTVVDGAAVPSTDAALIASNGYLYDMYAILGVEKTGLTADNCYSFEGAQGICPTGWHVPTRAEYLALCGYSTRSATEDAAVTDATALFFDTTYNSGRIGLANEAGWNHVFSGYVNKNFSGTTARYYVTLTTSSNCSVEEWIGRPSMMYYATSTCYQPTTNAETSELTNMQFFGMMTTFTSSYLAGRLSLSYANITNGMQVRCIKDAATE